MLIGGEETLVALLHSLHVQLEDTNSNTCTHAPLLTRSLSPNHRRTDWQPYDRTPHVDARGVFTSASPQTSSTTETFRQLAEEGWRRLRQAEEIVVLLEARCRELERLLLLELEKLNRAQEHAATVSNADEDRKGGIMLRIIKRTMNATLSSALSRWQERVGERKKVSAKAEKVVRRWTYQASAMCWVTWHVYYVDEARKRALLKRILAKMSHRSRFAAFSRWRECASQRKCMTAKASRVVGRWKNKASARCYAVWHVHCVDEAKKKALLMRIVTRMSQRLLCLTVRRWCEKMNEVKEEQMQEERKRDIMTRISKRMLNMALAAALSLWQSNVMHLLEERVEEERRMKIKLKIVIRLLNRLLSSAFQRWFETVEELKSMAGKATKVMARWRYKVVAMCVDVWHKQTAKVVGTRGRMERIVARMRSRSLSSFFDRWNWRTLDGAQQLTKLQSILVRLLCQSLSFCFRRWVEDMKNAKHAKTVRSQEERQQQRLQAIVNRMLNKSLSSALSRWGESIGERKWMSDKVRKALCRWKNKASVICWEAWHVYAAQEALRRYQEGRSWAMMKRIVANRSQKAQCAAFESWVQYSQSSRIIRAGMSHKARTSSTNRLRFAWQHWILNINFHAFQHMLDQAHTSYVQVSKRADESQAAREHAEAALKHALQETATAQAEASEREAVLQEYVAHVRNDAQSLHHVYEHSVSSAHACAVSQ
jgi:hypothetical protein